MRRRTVTISSCLGLALVSAACNGANDPVAPSGANRGGAGGEGNGSALPTGGRGVPQVAEGGLGGVEAGGAGQPDGPASVSGAGGGAGGGAGDRGAGASGDIAGAAGYSTGPSGSAGRGQGGFGGALDVASAGAAGAGADAAGGPTGDDGGRTGVTAGAAGAGASGGGGGASGLAGAGGAAGGPAGSLAGNDDGVGQGVRKTIVIDGANTAGEWGEDTLLIRDPAGDDARFLGSNWCAHETPWDCAALHAAWDDDNLYVGIQYVNVTDVIDPSNLASSEAMQLHEMELMQFVMFDTVVGGYSTGGDMWAREYAFAGPSHPDFQLYFRSSFLADPLHWGAWNGAAWGEQTDGQQTPALRGAAGEFFAGQTLPGVNPHSDDASPGDYSGVVVDYLTEGHQTTYDTFFELQVPLTLLGLPAEHLDSAVIGLLAAQGDSSAVDSVPNDPATSSTEGVSSGNSPLEWDAAIDADTFSVPFALVGTR